MKQIINLTKDLIKFETTRDKPEQLKKCINFVEKQLPKRLHIKKGIRNKKPYLTASVKNTKKPDLLLTAHLDVVEAEKDQFKPAIKNNKIFGRGSSDMKGGAAIAIQLLKEEKKKNIAIMLTTDEEIGGKEGVGFLSKTWNPKLVLSVEPSNQNITIKEKGLVHLRIKTKGKAAHGSRPWSGDNAIEKLMLNYHKIKKFFPRPDKNRWQITMNLGFLKGGEAFNKVPDEAEMGLDIRYTEKEDINKLLKKIRSIKGIKVEIVQKEPMLNTNEKDPQMQRLRKIARTISKDTDFRKETGASDIRYFARKNIPAADFGPKGKNIHGKGEFASIKSMENIYRILKKFIDTL